MSDISRHMCIFPPLSHCFVRALFRPAIALSFLAALFPCQRLPVPLLAPLWSQRTAAFKLPRGSRGSTSLAFPFWQPGALGVREIQNSTECVRDTVVFVLHIWRLSLLRRLQLLQRQGWSLRLWFCGQAARVLHWEGPCHSSVLQPCSLCWN